MKDLKSQFVDWLATMPADEAYEYTEPAECAFCQFLRAAGYPVVSVTPWHWWDTSATKHKIDDEIEAALILFEADKPNFGRTFGALRERLTRVSA